MFKWLLWDSELGWRTITRCLSEWRTIPDKQRKIHLARLGFEPATFGFTSPMLYRTTIIWRPAPNLTCSSVGKIYDAAARRRGLQNKSILHAKQREWIICSPKSILNILPRSGNNVTLSIFTSLSLVHTSDISISNENKGWIPLWDLRRQNNENFSLFRLFSLVFRLLAWFTR